MRGGYEINQLVDILASTLYGGGMLEMSSELHEYHNVHSNDSWKHLLPNNIACEF